MTITTGLDPRRAAHTASVLLVAGIAGGLGGGSAASAQTPLVRKPFTVMVGGRVPSDTSGLYFSAGLSYAFAKANSPIPLTGYALYQIYVDYAQIAFEGGRGAGFDAATGYDNTGPYEKAFGIGPAVTFHFSPQIAPAHPYVGMGAGYYSVKVYDRSNVKRLGGKLFAGLESKSGFLGEIDYTYAARAEGVNTGGFGARLGYRF